LAKIESVKISGGQISARHFFCQSERPVNESNPRTLLLHTPLAAGKGLAPTAWVW
jgi:hypothetical protein